MMSSDRPIIVNIVGGATLLEREIGDAIGEADGIELARSPLAIPDVLLVAGDAERSALDRCRELSATVPVVLVLDGAPSIAAVTAAMGAGARGTVGRPLDPFALVDAVRTAAAFSTLLDPHARRGHVIVVSGAVGGVGTSSIAYLLARASTAPAALLDLDLLGGDVGELAGVTVPVTAAGLAGETAGRRAWQRLAVDVEWGAVLASPRRPDLAWLVREGIAGELVRAAAERYPTVVVDIGRAVGPAIEVIREADAAVVVLRRGARHHALAVDHAAFLSRIGAERFTPHLVLNDVAPFAALGLERGRGSVGHAVVVPRMRRATLASPRPRSAVSRRLRAVVEGGR